MKTGLRLTLNTIIGSRVDRKALPTVNPAPFGIADLKRHCKHRHEYRSQKRVLGEEATGRSLIENTVTLPYAV